MPLSQADLVTYVRDLTGIQATDLANDTLIGKWLDETANEIGSKYKLGTVNSCATYLNVITDTQHQHLLAYGAAIKLLTQQGDDTNRAEVYGKAYDSLLQAFILFRFPTNAINSLTDTGLVNTVRELTGVYTYDVSDTQIGAWLLDAVYEVQSTNKWTWTPATTVTGFITNLGTAGLSRFVPILMWRTAARVLLMLGDQTKRSEYFMSEYSTMLNNLALADLNARGTSVGATGAELQKLRRLVRDLTSVYSETVADAVINQFINEAYREVVSAKEWSWLEGNITPYTLAAGSTSVTVSAAYRRILEVTATYADGTVVPVHNAASIVEVPTTSSTAFYDVDKAGGAITISPAFKESVTIKVRYIGKFTMLTGDTDKPLFDNASLPTGFGSILSYMAAIKVLAIVNDKGKKDKIQIYSESAASIFEQMVNEFVLDHDYRPLQLGGVDTVFVSRYGWM